jgi:hypothetical protein
MPFVSLLAAQTNSIAEWGRPGGSNMAMPL